MKYLAWYTKNTEYKKVFEDYLEPSLKRFNLDYIVKEMPNLHRWNKNVAQKPLAIKEALEEYKEPLVVLDVDAIITEEPILFNQIDPIKYELAFHKLNWSTWYNRPKDINKEVLTGTMWINYSNNMIDLCSDWYTLSNASGEWEQKILSNLLKDWYKETPYFELPIEYCYITSMPNGNPPFVKVDKPVICHYQKSRQLKSQIQ